MVNSTTVNWPCQNGLEKDSNFSVQPLQITVMASNIDQRGIGRQILFGILFNDGILFACKISSL